MFTRKLQMPQQGMPTAEEFALWGARELSFEELLAVNGGKRERKANSGGSSGRGSSGSSGSSGGSSGSSRSSRSAGTSSSSKGSSKSKEKKNKNSKTQSGTPAFDEKKSKPPVQSGTPSVNSPNAEDSKKNEEKQNGAAEYTVQKGDTLSGIVRKQYPGASKEEIVRRVKEAAANSGITDIDKIEPGQKILFEKPAQSSSGQPNAGEATSPTQGGGATHGRWGRPSGSGGVSGSTGGASSNSSGGESSGRGSSSGGGSSSSGNTDSGGSAWFNGRRNGGADWQAGKNPRMPPDWGTKEKQHTEGQEKGRDAGTDFAMPQEKRGFLAGLKERFNRGSRDGAGEWRNGLAGQENIKSVSSDGTWVNNGDATFTARKGATLSGLQRLTGKDWRESNWDKTRDPRTLQVGETVDMGKRTVKPENAITVSNTVEARKLYFGGNKSPVWLSDEIFRAVQSGPVTTYKINERIKTGATELAKGDWGENLTDIENMWFVGDTNIDYKIYTGTDITIVDMSAFVRDGCWDIIKGEGDATGPKKEVPFGSPYPFIERSWSISFPNPEKINWR